jgi:hypothetical protein
VGGQRGAVEIRKAAAVSAASSWSFVLDEGLLITDGIMPGLASRRR